VPSWKTWRLQTRDGDVLLREQGRDVDPFDVRSVTAETEHGLRVTADVVPEAGEGIRCFTRRATRVRLDGGPVENVSMAVVEVMLDRSDPSRYVRLYLHPEYGPILSTRDVNP
jgi:hypothetical protein